MTDQIEGVIVLVCLLGLGILTAAKRMKYKRYGKLTLVDIVWVLFAYVSVFLLFIALIINRYAMS
jgi:hypothetical protein